MRYPSNDEIDGLLRPEARAALPFARLLRIYLDPFFLFKDASRGTPGMQERSIRYNCAMRWMLLHYIRRWLAIALLLFAGIEPVQARAADNAILLIPVATLAIGCALAVVIITCAACCYVFLGAKR